MFIEWTLQAMEILAISKMTDDFISILPTWKEIDASSY
jgi:hypothetical protein